MPRLLLRSACIAAAVVGGCNSLFQIDEGKPRPICVDTDLAEALIDDMEDRDGFICALDGRRGHWYSVGDTTPGAELTPAAGFDPTKIPGGRGTSQYAAHLAGSGFTEWGALMGVNMNDGPELGRLPYNASNAGGVKFWMKSNAPVSVEFVTVETALLEEGGNCSDTSTARNCHNAFAFQITAPNRDWFEYEVPFAALTQPGGSAPWNPSQLLALQFSVPLSVPPGAPFDLWIDDLRFDFCATAGCKLTCTDPAFPVPCPASGRVPAGCRPPGTDCAQVVSWCADPLLIDDMEDANAQICATDGRQGYWYVASDGTSTDLMPRVDAAFVQTMIPGGRGTSHYAARMTGSGFAEFGAVMGFGFSAVAGVGYDASAHSGIAFWMKSNVAVSVNFPTLEARPPDAFAFIITAPGGDWVEYQVPFSALSQNDGSTTWNPSHLLNIDFMARKDTAFDVWVDDIRFYDDCSASNCVPTCTDPAFPVQCPANATSPAGCRRPATDCATFVRGCAASNTTVAPGDGRIATFNGADGGADIRGDVFARGDPGLATTTTDGALHLALNAPATPKAQALLAVDHFKDCVDATAFTGVEFSMSGFLSGCTLGYFTEDGSHLFHDGAPYGTHGTARAGIQPAFVPLTAGQITSAPQTVRVPFAGILAGYPATPIDQTKITGVGWAFLIDPSAAGAAPPCVADFTIDDIRFY